MKYARNCTNCGVDRRRDRRSDSGMLSAFMGMRCRLLQGLSCVSTHTAVRRAGCVGLSLATSQTGRAAEALESGIH